MGGSDKLSVVWNPQHKKKALELRGENITVTFPAANFREEGEVRQRRFCGRRSAAADTRKSEIHLSINKESGK